MALLVYIILTTFYCWLRELFPMISFPLALSHKSDGCARLIPYCGKLEWNFFWTPPSLGELLSAGIRRSRFSSPQVHGSLASVASFLSRNSIALRVRVL
jgi:hypothetical protein